MRDTRGIEHGKHTGLTSENVLTLLCARYARYAALHAYRELIRRTESQEFKSTEGQTCSGCLQLRCSIIFQAGASLRESFPLVRNDVTSARNNLKHRSSADTADTLRDERPAVSPLIFCEKRRRPFLPRDQDTKIPRRERAGEFTTHQVRMYTRIESSITAVIPRRGRESRDQKRRHRPRQQVENTMRAWSHLRPGRVSRIILLLVLSDSSPWIGTYRCPLVHIDR
jgi:hypothetical protein